MAKFAISKQIAYFKGLFLIGKTQTQYLWVMGEKDCITNNHQSIDTFYIT